MKRVVPLLVLLAALPACGEQTKWIYRNPSTGGGTLVDDGDENHTLRNVRLTAAGSTTARIYGSNGASGDYDLSLPVVGEDGATSYTIVGFSDGCFQDNRSIRSIVFPPGLEAIPNRCFQSCSGLTNAPLPATLVSIGSSAFSGCSSLTGDIVLPDAVEEVNNVWRSTKITSFTAGAGLLSIGNSSFQDMSSITNLDLSRAVSLRSIGASCFESARNMVCDLSGAGLPRTVSTLGKNAFYGCSKAFGDVVLPDAVTSVASTFRGTRITSFTAGSGLLSIGSSSFQDMSSITNLDLSPAVSLRSIGSSCFQSARNMACDLSGAGLPRTLETIGSSAFYSCPKVTGDVVLPDSVAYVTNTFRSTAVTSFAAGAGLRSLSNESFKDMSSLRHLDLSAPTNLAYIGSSCFASCSGITNALVLPESGLRTIGSQAFWSCRGMGGDIVLPETVTNLPKQVFGYTAIASVTAKGVRSIGEQCFKGASSLARIELGWGLDALLGSECIDGASSLKAVYWRSPPDPAKCDGEAPLGTWDWRANGCTNYIPWSPRTRTAAQPWADFADEYNRTYGEIVLPTRRYGVGTLKRTGKSATEHVAYWLPDLDPVTVLLLR
jgi:hypothetical protein